MPQPILPTIHSQNCTSEGASLSFSSLPKESDKQVGSRQPYITPFEDDPVWMKCKSVVFHGAGRVQKKLGAVTGVEALANRGQAWVSWAAHASEQAEFLTEHGASSRLNSEYNRWIGYFRNIFDHSDTHNDSQLGEQTNDELSYSRCRSSSA